MNPSATAAGHDLQRVSSRHDVEATVAALRSALEARGITVFAEIDHAAAARQAGLDMPPTRVLLFGNPKGGTPLMEQHPDLALDLPLRVLVRQRSDGKAEVLWHSTAAMERSQGMPAGSLDGLQQLQTLVRNTVDGLGN
ncbi:DUF302 domain-containing protein [Luteimonas sp. e5]